ncbi:Zn-dependent alcohol dehydrogenase [Oricola thermophila]|uniref:Zn-dependent alcohol dehydrogenase n=1 Tax=Oricola thermophila TaxID=2742145 RepID=A0A6N1VC78_9HYPH|nr:Zn-dependent alcohol dehydrogenase [Oricola thermophila]QKV17145.1 Zn-dependent alcohol dehydrogenase [Oricola thermophila]
MPETIRAAVCREFDKPLAIETVTLADPGPGEVKVAVKACAICHSDIIFAEGGWGGELPMVLGHEAAGVVETVGPGVTGIAPGDHAVVTLIRSCGNCHYCSGGHQVLCEEVFPLDRQSPISNRTGETVGHGLRTGAFAEKVVVEKSQVAVIPKDIAFEAASLLACGVITGFGAVTNTAQVPAGAHVAVIGCGGVGLNAVQGALAAGAKTIIAIDLSSDKLRVAERFGATLTLDPVDPGHRDALLAATDGRGVDYCFVTVGAKPAIDGASQYITRNGAVVIVGMPPSGVRGEYDPGTLAGWGQRIIGSKMGSAQVARDIPELVALYQAGRLKLDELVTGRFTLERINDAIASTKRGEALRNVVVFD